MARAFFIRLGGRVQTAPPNLAAPHPFRDDAARRVDRLVSSWLRRYHNLGLHRWLIDWSDGHPNRGTASADNAGRQEPGHGSRDGRPSAFVQLGYWYRLHRKDLPGKPDIAFMSRRKAIFVHGCFWHGHDCPKGRLPTSRIDYWKPKLNGNSERDRRTEEALCSLGWSVLVIWQCETTAREALARRLHSFLDDGPARSAPEVGRGRIGSNACDERGCEP